MQRWDDTEYTNLKTYIKIDLKAVEYNLREIKKLNTPNTNIMAVVKSDAYGHGMLPISKFISEKSLVSAFAEIGRASCRERV